MTIRQRKKGSHSRVALSPEIKHARKLERSAARFWATVDKNGPNGCWEWRGHLDRRGYGRYVSFYGTLLAHRIGWQLTHGTPPPSKPFMLCHHCDNRKCVNPSHLFIGTNSDNQLDASAKGRQRNPANQGDANPGRKICAADAARIHSGEFIGQTTAQIGQRFGIKPPTVRLIQRGKLWKSAFLAAKGVE